MYSQVFLFYELATDRELPWSTIAARLGRTYGAAKVHWGGMKKADEAAAARKRSLEAAAPPPPPKRAAAPARPAATLPPSVAEGDVFSWLENNGFDETSYVYRDVVMSVDTLEELADICAHQDWDEITVGWKSLKKRIFMRLVGGLKGAVAARSPPVRVTPPETPDAAAAADAATLDGRDAAPDAADDIWTVSL